VRGGAAIVQGRLVRLLVLALPYAWLLLFFLLPFLIVAKIALSEPAVGIPPYAPILRWSEERVLTLVLNLGNFAALAEDRFYLDAYLRSIRIAGVSALLCMLIGYPMAYAIARALEHRRNLLVMLVVLPFWTSFLLRVMAWIGLLGDQGVINGLLLWLGLIGEPLRLLYTDAAVYLGIVYCYLPFMVLPLYATLVKLDPALIEAAADLGARPWRAFLTITLPLSLPGLAAGGMLVFIPAIGEFVIPELLGGPAAQLAGRVLWVEFFQNRDWPMASALAVALVLVLVVPIAALQRLSATRGLGLRAGR